MTSISTSLKTPKSSFEAKKKKLYQSWKIFSSNKVSLLSLFLLLFLVFVASFAFWIAPHDPTNVDLSLRLQGFSKVYLLGTDELGRDILSRLVFGTRTTIYVVFLIIFFTVPLGVAVGVVAGYAGKWVDRCLMRLTDIFLALPRLILALAFVAAMGPGLLSLVVAISLTAWTSYARIARSETILIRKENFVKAAELQGASSFYILWHYILPLCLPSVVVRVTYDMAGIILMAAGFGFLGLGVQPPLPEWGTMVASGQPYLLDHWWVSAIPGFTIFVTSLALNFVGDGLRDVIDPRQNY
jgi:peptide/nickel transport system permease protein